MQVFLLFFPFSCLRIRRQPIGRAPDEHQLPSRILSTVRCHPSRIPLRGTGRPLALGHPRQDQDRRRPALPRVRRRRERQDHSPREGGVRVARQEDAHLQGELRL